MNDKIDIPSISSKRLMFRYAEDGGTEKDNIIEIRPGVDDLTLGDRTYAQVRIGIDGTHYLKGIAIYAADPEIMPDDVDIIYNTSKSKNVSRDSILNPINLDSSNPFDKDFRQWEYQDSNGNFHVSPLNIVNDNHDWGRWEHSSIAQFLARKDPTKPDYFDDSSAVNKLCQMLFM